MAEPSKGEERDLLEEGKEAFQLAVEAEDANRKEAKEDVRFARLSEQWPEDIRKMREDDDRPCLTRNLMPAFIRQVVNDARQNKPSIKVHPADDDADPETAEIMNGLIRNIEYTSDAEVAYDTATECAVDRGWGYFKIDYDYAHDDTVDLDIFIQRVANPFSIYGDPYSMAADSSDWNSAFEIEYLTEDEFERQFPNAESPTDWSDAQKRNDWTRGEEVLIAKWWQREEVEKQVYRLSDGQVVESAVYDAQAGLFQLAGIEVVRQQIVKSYKVRRHILSGAEVLKTDNWLGKYIPIVPVYGDEVIDDEGKRHWRSLIRDAKDTQRQYNYWQSAATELVALAPKVPWIGPKGAFKTDARNWATANRVSHPYLEFDGQVPPTRQMLDSGPAAGALQQAMTAREDMSAIIGLHAASMGAPSNETSGRAILVRQREGDVSTFHFQDNMSRAIRHAGRILIDLIPKIYSGERIVRVMGEDGTPENVPLNRPVPVKDQNGQPAMRPKMDPMGRPMQDPNQGGRPFMEQVTRIYDLSVGKYDLTVTTGPSFTTKREEAAVQQTEFLRIWPQAAPLVGDIIAKNLDWPGADEISKRLKKMLPPQLQEGGLPPEVQQKMQMAGQQIQQMQQTMEQMQAYILKLESDRTNNARKVDVDQYEAETDRLKALSDIQKNGTNVPDAPTNSVYADFEGLVAQAEANKLNATAEKERANAGLAAARMLREMNPEPSPGVPRMQTMPRPRTF